MVTVSEILERQERKRRELFQIYVDLRRQAAPSEDFELHRLAAEAYKAFMRSFLDADERHLLDLEEQMAEMQAELNDWRRGVRRSE